MIRLCQERLKPRNAGCIPFYISSVFCHTWDGPYLEYSLAHIWSTRWPIFGVLVGWFPLLAPRLLLTSSPDFCVSWKPFTAAVPYNDISRCHRHLAKSVFAVILSSLLIVFFILKEAGQFTMCLTDIEY